MQGSDDTSHPSDPGETGAAVESQEDAGDGTAAEADIPADWLEQEVDEWVDDDLVSPSQAQRILARYGLAGGADLGTESRDLGRAVTILSLMGALLVGTGILLALGTVWDDLPRLVRVGVLLFVTGAFLASGYELRTRRTRPRTGHVLHGLGSLSVGVSIFEIDSMYAIADGDAVLLLGWGGLTLVLAHAVRSRPIVGIGLLATSGAFWEVVPEEQLLPYGLFTLSLYGVYLGVRTAGDSRIAGAYQLFSIAGTLYVLLAAIPTSYDPLDGLAPAPSQYLFALALLAGTIVSITIVAAVRDRTPIAAAVWIAFAGAVLGSTILASMHAPGIWNGVARVLIWNALGLGVLVATVGLGYAEGSRLVLNGTFVAFLLQLALVLETTLFEALPGSLALVVSGLVLLLVGITLERGRRDLLERMAGQFETNGNP